MAKTRFGGLPRRFPSWPLELQTQAAPSLANTTGQVTAVGGKVMVFGHVMWADGADHNASIIHWRQGNVGLTGTVNVSLRDPSTAAGPPGRDDGTADQSGDQVDTVAQTNYSTPLNAVRALAQGQLACLVWEVTARTAGTFSLVGVGGQTSANYNNRPNITLFDGTSTYTPLQMIPCVTLEADDGTIGILAGAFPRLSALDAVAFDNATAFTEFAMRFTVEKACYAGDVMFFLMLAAGADVDLVLYQGTTALKTVSVVTDTVGIEASPRPLIAGFGDVLLEPGNDYYVAAKPASANDVTAYYIDVSDASHLAAFAGLHNHSTRAGAAWAAATATRLPIATIGFVGDESAGGDGGARSLLNPGIN